MIRDILKDIDIVFILIFTSTSKCAVRDEIKINVSGKRLMLKGVAIWERRRQRQQDRQRGEEREGGLCFTSVRLITPLVKDVEKLKLIKRCWRWCKIPTAVGNINGN